MASASAPGKIILFGEHAVVYGRPALAVPVGVVRASADCLTNERMLSTDCGTDERIGSTDRETDERIKTDLGGKWAESVLIEAPDIKLFTSLGDLQREQPDHPLATVIMRVFQALGVVPPPMTIRVTSTIPVASGLGSGAAVSVAVIRSIAETLQRPFSDEQVNQIAYDVEKLHHGTPSGIDNTVITYNRPVYFVRGQPIQTFRVAKAFMVAIADTGVFASTRESVGDVRKLWEADQSRWERVFDQVGAIAQAAKKAIENGETNQLGALMDSNHALLQEMTVSCPELDTLVAAAKAAGAEGAKLSGGGRGGNMIALVSPHSAENVSAALKSAGAKNVIISQIG